MLPLPLPLPLAKLHTTHLFPRYSWRDRSISPALFYFTNHHEANAHLARLPHGPIGFDLEWRPNYRKGQSQNRVALVQLATADTVILLHIHHMTQFPSQLAELLSSPFWIKAGVSIQYDCTKLYHDYGVSVRNCVELSLLARTVDNARWKGNYTNPLGLARLVETYEQATLLKGRVQRSNWEHYLNEFQQEYAANDAHAGYIIYSRLFNMAQAMDPAPLPTYYSFSLVDNHLRDSSGIFPWQAHNPDYDPGPPPPPKPKDLDKDSQGRQGLGPVIASELQHHNTEGQGLQSNPLFGSRDRLQSTRHRLAQHGRRLIQTDAQLHRLTPVSVVGNSTAPESRTHRKS